MAGLLKQAIESFPLMVLEGPKPQLPIWRKQIGRAFSALQY